MLEQTIRDLLKRPAKFDLALAHLVNGLKADYGLSRVTVMLYNKADNMLESVSASGVPNIDHRNIRAPVIRLPGISSRAVEARSFLENRPIVVRNRSEDPQYRMRHKFPHKAYSREFAIFPLTANKRKLGIVAVSVDDNNPAKLTTAVANRIADHCRDIALIILRSKPKPPSDRELIDAVNEILHKDMITAAFQPIVDIRQKRIHGHETLMRVDHPLISSPLVLLDCAEKLNVLRDVSFDIHRAAMRRVDNLERGQKLFINLHPRDFIEYENLDDPTNPFYGADLSKLVLEITERYLLQPDDRIHSIIRFFKGLGAGIALDDLGSGFSNLEVLTSLEPDYIKLDISLIREIHRNKSKQKLIKSLLYYCEQIGCACIAEGIETEEEYGVLSELDCSLIQGFYLARPGPRFMTNRELKARLKRLAE